MDRRSLSGCRNRPSPPFSPVLLLGFMVRVLPPGLLQPIFDRIARDVRRRHPRLFERLGGSGDPVYLVDPVDLPFNVALRPNGGQRNLWVVRPGTSVDATATIRGSLVTLLRLFEGHVDGDALFFSRELVVEGDTEAIVALRNSVDGEGIDLAKDLLDALGPFAKPARHLATLGALAADDMETIRRALVSPLERRLDDQDTRVRALAAQWEARPVDGTGRRRSTS